MNSNLENTFKKEPLSKSIPSRHMTISYSNFFNLLNDASVVQKKQEKWYMKLIKFTKKKKDHKKLIEAKIFPQSAVKKMQLPYQIRHFGSDAKRKKNFLVTVWLVKKFIQIIKTYTYVKKIFRLKKFHFEAIGDISNYYSKGSDFGESFFENLTNRASQNYVPKFFL